MLNKCSGPEISEAVDHHAAEEMEMHFDIYHMKVLHWDTDLYSFISDLKDETVVTLTKHLDTFASSIAFCMYYS